VAVWVVLSLCGCMAAGSKGRVAVHPLLAADLEAAGRQHQPKEERSALPCWRTAWLFQQTPTARSLCALLRARPLPLLALLSALLLLLPLLLAPLLLLLPSSGGGSSTSAGGSNNHNHNAAFQLFFPFVLPACWAYDQHVKKAVLAAHLPTPGLPRSLFSKACAAARALDCQTFPTPRAAVCPSTFQPLAEVRLRIRCKAAEGKGAG